MAIQKTVIDWEKSGNYIRISKIKNNEIVNGNDIDVSVILVEVWANATVREDARLNRITRPEFYKCFSFPSITTSIADGYTKLKTLPEFSGGIDV